MPRLSVARDAAGDRPVVTDIRYDGRSFQHRATLRRFSGPVGLFLRFPGQWEDATWVVGGLSGSVAYSG